ncbi:hypothetical protein F3Y22_tig00004630pilonHSYRG00038 [Hibiscus syriacus]|uniref:non-specific serine/threonine protein kinase n=1 Tax=Hibiscus syriacus TaxID=106335 RepID=A0A6A3CG88_HIBSY|nr:hypothetical protein F3Y22_tig00004630pilonHSYRG00038 [Hibiscus syriacus]
MERYEILKDIGSGNFGVATLVRDKRTGELFAVKYIERGPKIDEHVEREIMNHRSLKHPNIMRFKEVFVTYNRAPCPGLPSSASSSSSVILFYYQVLLTPTHLAIVMEYAAGGELFERICNVGRFSEDEARFVFQQLISGIADVWSCGVTLYVMLVEAYPFEDPEDPRNFRKTIQQILSVHYSIPDHVRLSKDCKNLLSRIFVADPGKNLAMEGEDGKQEIEQRNNESQSVEEVVSIIDEASEAPKVGAQILGGSMDLDDADIDAVDTSASLTGGKPVTGRQPSAAVTVTAGHRIRSESERIYKNTFGVSKVLARSGGGWGSPMTPSPVFVSDRSEECPLVSHRTPSGDSPFGGDVCGYGRPSGLFGRRGGGWNVGVAVKASGSSSGGAGTCP